MTARAAPAVAAGVAAPATEEFVAFFREGWGIGATDPERFYAHIGSRLTPGAAMIQPLAATTYGHAGLRELFAPLFATIPDLRGDIVRWGESADGVLIELHLHGTLGSRPIAWTVVDRIVLRDGMIAERRSYFDPLPVAAQLLRAPRAARRLLPALLRRRR
jgi:hypothetical protein